MRRTLIFGLCLLASLAGCGSEAPTGVDTPVGPRSDTGLMVGSGNRSGDGGSGTTPTSTGTSGSTTTVAFGGWTMGSGN